VNPISHRLSWAYQKNEHLIQSLLLRNAPAFVYGADPAECSGEVPVFTFHGVEPARFERQCRFLADNGYRTLSAEEFGRIMHSGRTPPKKSIVLTFDDGLKSMWTVAYPLLRRHGLQAICFLVPGCIPADASEPRPTLDDVPNGQVDPAAAQAPERGPAALATWSEIEAMHDSGVVDFQSHTLHHGLVFTSPAIFDFVHPGYDPYVFGNIHIPLYTENGRDVVTREPINGMPIYASKPRMQAVRRLYDDEQIRERCLAVVRDAGEDFFRQRGWRRALRRVVEGARRASRPCERFETEEERDRAILEELGRSREIIAQRLPGKPVDQLCFPWYHAEAFAVEAARKAGYRLTYFGRIKGRPGNRPEERSGRIVREEEMFVERLPGRGRRSLSEVLRRHIQRN